MVSEGFSQLHVLFDEEPNFWACNSFQTFEMKIFCSSYLSPSHIDRIQSIHISFQVSFQNYLDERKNLRNIRRAQKIAFT